jgi:hypothetical protein
MVPTGVESPSALVVSREAHVFQNSTTQFWMRCTIFTPASCAGDAGSEISQLAVLFRAIATI